MAKREKLSVDDFFGEIDQTQEVYNLRERVQQLEQNLQLQVARERSLTAEIEQMRTQAQDTSETEQLQAQIVQLRQLLEAGQGKAAYPIAKMRRNPNQPRQTFVEEVEMMKLSLQREGQLTAVILYPDGLIFDGECRWRAASELGWEYLDAVWIGQPDETSETRRRAYLTSLHRRSLNDLDRAEALVAIVCDEHPDIQPEEVVRIVNRVIMRLKRQRKIGKLSDRLHLQPLEVQKQTLMQLDLSPSESKVFQVLLALQEHPASLERNIFPALKLAIDLKRAVREQGLGCSQAKELNRLTADKLHVEEAKALELREAGVALALEQGLSAEKLRAWVVEQYKPLTGSPNRQITYAIQSLRSFYQIDFSQVSDQERQDLRHHLAGLLNRLDNVP